MNPDPERQDQQRQLVMMLFRSGQTVDMIAKRVGTSRQEIMLLLKNSPLSRQL